MYNTRQNKHSNKLQTVCKLKHSLSEIQVNTTKDELFGLRTTKYRKENCSMKCQQIQILEKKKYFAYITEHVAIELIKLKGMQLYSKCIIVEEAKNKSTTFSEANVFRPTSPVFGNHLTDGNQS